MSDGLLKLFFYLRRKTGSFLFEVFLFLMAILTQSAVVLGFVLGEEEGVDSSRRLAVIMAWGTVVGVLEGGVMMLSWKRERRSGEAWRS